MGVIRAMGEVDNMPYAFWSEMPICKPLESNMIIDVAHTSPKAADSDNSVWLPRYE